MSEQLAPPQPPPRLMQMATGFILSRLVYTAASLGIADHLAGDPKPAGELAPPAQKRCARLGPQQHHEHGRPMELAGLGGVSVNGPDRQPAFEAVPRGASAYLLSHVIYDWNEDQCLTILRNCRAAMTLTSRLLLIELGHQCVL